MNGGVVLTGSVPSYPQYVQAAAVAARAAGLRCVRNHLQVAACRPADSPRPPSADIQIRDLEQA